MRIAEAPILESGDRLTREEFHARYCARVDIKRAELVEGVVYVASPVRLEGHGNEHNISQLWLGAYAARHPDLLVGDNATVYLDDNNELQPDGFLVWRDPSKPGAHLTPEGYAMGAPLLVMEIVGTTAAYDLHDKKEAYRRNGVLEYIAWLTNDRMIRWYRLRDGEYVEVEPEEDGTIESAVFPGLRMHIPSMVARDRAGVLKALDLPQI